MVPAKLNSLMAWMMVSIVAFGMFGCKKSTPAPAVEETLVVITTPATGTTLMPQPLGNGLPIEVKVTSAMPSDGVIVKVVGQNEITNATFYTQSITNKLSTNNFVVTGIPIGWACIATITVTSVKKASNTWSGTVRFSGK